MSIQHRKVLVLNKSWSAIRVVTLERAITFLFSAYKNGEPKARIIEENDYTPYSWDEWSKLSVESGSAGIHTANSVFRIPEIIQLTRYDKIPNQNKKVTFSRNALYKRDEGKCAYCDVNLDLKSSTIDHIVPTSRGGTSSWLNCVLSCVICNGQKADRILEESINKKNKYNWRGSSPMKLIKMPKNPTFSFFDEYKEKYLSWSNFLK